jgi:hypothetical protein
MAGFETGMITDMVRNQLGLPVHDPVRKEVADTLHIQNAAVVGETVIDFDAALRKRKVTTTAADGSKTVTEVDGVANPSCKEALETVATHLAEWYKNKR